MGGIKVRLNLWLEEERMSGDPARQQVVRGPGERGVIHGLQLLTRESISDLVKQRIL